NTHGNQPIVHIPEATKKGYAEAEVGDSINIQLPTSKTKRGRVGKQIANTIGVGVSMQQHTLTENAQIRRLTPLECECLMGLPDNWTKYGINTEQLVSYKECGNIELCNQTKIKKIKNKNVQFRVVTEQKKPTSVFVSCTIKDGKGKEILTRELEQTNTNINVNIAIEKLEDQGVWECVTNITKCTDSMEMHYTLKKNVPLQVEMDIYEKQTELIPIEELWKNTSEEYCDITKLSTILIAINLITNCLISTFVQGKSMQVSMRPLERLSKKELKWEILFLKTENIEKMSDSARYKLCGNGVVVNVVEEIIKRLL
ncbi:MAG: DNA cytosine methyltransferase, partial [Candidatus Aenigmarchaeota archaeon]|nr:DNA cytosine methyltransferase [Candidatus Aenigmarchaeota archaeon]